MLTILFPFLASSAAACATSSPGADASTDVPDGSSPDGSSAIDAAPDAKDAKDGGPFCCPPDPNPSGCMALGGVGTGFDGGCGRTCDFFCSTNWRIENDSSGCPTWKWDTRAPLPDENGSCFKKLDAGTD
jgi:hypothetical protein